MNEVTVAFDILVNLAIVVFLISAWCWNLPDDALGKRFIRPFRGVILYLGLWHGWNMFAPEPLMVNRRLLALLHLADGRTVEWRPSEIGQMSCWRAFCSVRDRKWQDNVLSGKLGYLKPALCEFLERESATRGDVVTKIELVQFRRRVTDPWGTRKSQEPEKEQRKVIFVWNAPNGASRRVPSTSDAGTVVSTDPT